MFSLPRASNVEVLPRLPRPSTPREIPTARGSTCNRVAIPPVLPCCEHFKREHHPIPDGHVGSRFVVQAAEQTAHSNCGPRRRPRVILRSYEKESRIFLWGRSYRHEIMWTKSVLLFGALALGWLLLFQLLPLEYFYVLPVSARAPGALFEGLGPAVRFWFGLLAIALVRDYVVSRRDRSIVRPFAKVLNPQPLPGDDSVTQVSDDTVLSTSTSGSVS